MVYESVHHGFLLPVRKPENVTGLHVDDDRRVLVSVVQLKFVDPEESRLTFRLDELFAVDGILLLQALSVDLLDDVFPKPGDLRNRLVRQAKREQVPGVLLQFTGDVVVFGLERDFLHLAVTAGWAIITAFVEADTTQLAAEVQVPQTGRIVAVDVHPAAALRANAVRRMLRELAQKNEYVSAAFRFLYDGFRIVEPKQPGWHQQFFLNADIS